MPLSMIEVQSSTWNFFSMKASITFSSCALAHLPVRHADGHLGHQLLEQLLHRVDGLHAVVDEEDLPAALAPRAGSPRGSAAGRT